MRDRFAAIILCVGRIATVIFALSAAGCANLKERSDGFTDSLAEIGQQLRPVSGTGKQFGMTSKAREIESNLGYK